MFYIERKIKLRKTKIICTIGPSSESEEKLKELMLAGMDVARFNMSHGTHEEHKIKCDRVRNIAEELGLPIATMLDTKGPEIRLCDIEGYKTDLVKGQKFTLTTKDILGNNEIVSITYKNLIHDVSVGKTILLDDGLIELLITEITDTDIICEVQNGGPISNHKGVNVPGVILSMPYISETDEADIIFGIQTGFDFIAASFARSREDIMQIKSLANAYGSNIKIIAKIENMQGIENVEEILEASDGIMVARGDMGVEIPMEEVPVLQKSLIKKAVTRGKYVITATQMLDSMIKNPRPTRAETTDVANAIYDGTTAIMLSGESAAGLYPIEAVKTMVKIAVRAEDDIDYVSRMKKTEIAGSDITTAISHACCNTAIELNAAAIISITMSGFTAGMVSRYKPNCPIIGCAITKDVCRQLNLMWGVKPVLIGRKNTAEELFDAAIAISLEKGLLKKGDVVVLTAGMPLGVSGKTNMIRVIEV